MKKSETGRIVNVSSRWGALSLMGGHQPGYRISKAALNAMTLIFADELKNTNISVNSMSPGWVRTDMGGYNADRSVEDGADTVTWMATKEEKSTGKFYADRKEIDW